MPNAHVHANVNPLNGKRTWVKIHPEDPLVGLDPIFLTDPKTFTPQIHPRTNKYEAWGILSGVDADTQSDEEMSNFLVSHVMRQAQVGQLLYYGVGCPQTQFVKQLMARKERQMAMHNISDRKYCDYILRITMTEILDGDGKEIIHRSIKVSGGISLNTFQDKILGPVMGWSRNYHAYLLTDRTDGALFGPSNAAYIDLMHMHFNGYEFLSDAKYTLADVLDAPGSSLGYLYDLGDQWQHEITVEKILPKECSGGSFELLAGGGVCPGEDQGGNQKWNDMLAKCRRNPGNYKSVLDEHGVHCYSSYNDLLRFNISEARARVQAALVSRLSDRADQSSMGYSSVGFMGGLSNMFGSLNTASTTGRARARAPAPADCKSQALCEGCGKPWELKSCSRCKSVWYCSRECQTRCWDNHKKFARPQRSNSACQMLP